MPDTPALPPILLNARDAARALSISERTLWSLTSPRGPIPVVRVGSRGVRYSIRALEAFAKGDPAGDQGDGGRGHD